MTEELKLDLMKKFKKLNVAEYTTKYGDYYGLMFAGAEIATKELEAQIEKMNELINRYYEVCVQIPKEYRTMVFDSCLEDTRQLRR